MSVKARRRAGWAGEGGLQNLARAVPGNEGREEEKQGSSVDRKLWGRSLVGASLAFPWYSARPGAV